MSKILGLDLGTNSIGWSIRNTQLPENQTEKFGVIIYTQGVGKSKTGEYSYAAQRTKKRSTRHLYQSRKYRLWATLEILIIEGYCPLSMEALNRWRHYEKGKGRIYPKNDAAFEQWIKLDFNGDSKPDYKSPYQLRRVLIEEKFDFNNEIDRYKLGRALYHIAQRRGFKSSRKGSDDIKENADGEDIDLQYSEKKKNKELITQYGKYPNAKTIGSLFAYMEDDGIRIRENIAQYAIRENFKDEINQIFNFQNIPFQNKLYQGLVETGKNRNDGTIFYKRPLRSQKGLIGLCTLEQETRFDPKTNKPFQVGKYRAPISHPNFELFRAWQFLNNIKFKEENNKSSIWQPLDLELKKEILKEKFFRKSKAYFPFSEIADFIKKKGFKWILNYKPKQTVTGCPVSARLKEIFGDDYLNIKIEKEPSAKQKKNYYDIYDIWHILFSFEDQEFVAAFAVENLKLNEEQAKKIVFAWNSIPVGYGILSINAIDKINRFLFKGLQYTESVLLANLPSLVGEDIWKKNEDDFIENIAGIIQDNRDEKHIIQIINSLVAKYKNLDQKFGYKDDAYVLDEKDVQDITDAIIEHYGESHFLSKSKEEADIIFNTVKDCYQAFFKTKDLNRIDIDGERHFLISTNGKNYYKADSGFYKQPKLKDTLAEYASKVLKIDISKLKKIYHHSDISIYPAAMADENGVVKMGSPKTGSFKNPMAMRTLQELKKLLNYLIESNQIDSETKVIVEVARQLNDTNKRWAIEAWQRQREVQNMEFAIAIDELVHLENVKANSKSDADIDKMRLWYEQNAEESVPEISETKKEIKGIRWSENKKQSYKDITAKKTAIEKYRLWKEQKCICIYTGKIISITDLFNDNIIDFEHTLPRSKSFDNSLTNKTVCFKDYNRTVKKQLLPSQLPNYDTNAGGYTAILPRLKNWEEKIERIKQQIDFWQTKSKKAADKQWKDDAIRQKHLWKMELEYWGSKVERFKMQEITSGFKNSQLVDTQLISKYALHYLKTYFEKVDVQKGEVTAIFRKIYALQPQNFDEKKDRSKHSHHAKDATILTLIPQVAKREEILKDYFEKQEKGIRYEPIKPYPNFNISSIFEIDDKVLVNSLNNIQFLSKVKKVIRKRGKVQFVEGTDKIKIATGDAIRGQLHQETFYGAMKPAKFGENGRMYKDENGNFIQEEKLKFTIRVPFQYKSKPDTPGFKNWEEIEKQVVDTGLKQQIKKQIDNAGGFKEAFEEGIYLLDKNGNPHGNKIRHIRVWASVSDPLKIKKQTYLSSKEYKQHYYAANATNSYFALYQDKEKTKKDFDFRNLMDVAQSMAVENIQSEKDLFEPFITIKRGKIEKQLNLKCILKPGARVLFLKDNEIINEISNAEIFNRLYVYTNFEKDGRLNFRYHLEARNKIEGNYSESEIDWEKPKPTLRFSYTKYNFIVENYDFIIQMDGTVKKL
ncbi:MULTISPECIES: type II CRISPR RNA-guided endonuclease Cas9 [Chitinophagaceae]